METKEKINIIFKLTYIEVRTENWKIECKVEVIICISFYNAKHSYLLLTYIKPRNYIIIFNNKKNHIVEHMFY